MKKRILLATMLLLGAGAAQAQTVTVAKTGSPSFATIAAALASFSPDPDGGAPNVIQITDSALYDEAISITVPVTITGTGVSRPIIAAQQGPTQIDTGAANLDGVVITLTAPGAVSLSNLIIIPSRTLTPTDDLVRSGGTNAITGSLSNVLITSNNGSDAPVSTTGLASVDLTGSTSTGDDGAFLAGTGADWTLTDVVITHINGTTTGVDGLVCSSAASAYTIGDGCVFSFNKRLGIQANATQSFVISAPTTRVLVTGNLGFAGIWFAGAQSTTRSINGLNVIGNLGTNNAGKAWGIEAQNRGTIATTISNAIIAGNTGEGIVVGTTGTGDVNISNTTIANNGFEAIEYVTGSTGGTITVTDSILAGNGSAGVDQIVKNDTTFALNVSNSAIVTAGPAALTGAGTGGTGTVGTTAVISADPTFTSTTYGAAGFYQVTNTAYAAAATASANLKGGGTYSGSAPTAAEVWSIYN